MGGGRCCQPFPPIYGHGVYTNLNRSIPLCAAGIIFHPLLGPGVSRGLKYRFDHYSGCRYFLMLLGVEEKP